MPKTDVPDVGQLYTDVRVLSATLHEIAEAVW